MDLSWAIGEGLSDEKCISGVILDQKNLRCVLGPTRIRYGLDGSVFGANIYFCIKAVPQAQQPFSDLACFGHAAKAQLRSFVASVFSNTVERDCGFTVHVDFLLLVGLLRA
jgi:hypothetical protein